MDTLPIRVLLVDDDGAIRRLLKAVLAGTPIVVVGEADDGCVGLAVAACLEPDVVLTDYRMPMMDGLEATRLLKQLPHPPRVVLYTSDTSMDLPTRAAAVGVDAVLAKGCRIDMIPQALERVCAPAELR